MVMFLLSLSIAGAWESCAWIGRRNWEDPGTETSEARPAGQLGKPVQFEADVTGRRRHGEDS